MCFYELKAALCLEHFSHGLQEMSTSSLFLAVSTGCQSWTAWCSSHGCSLTSLNMISLLHVSPNLKTHINPLVFAHHHSVYCKLPTESLLRIMGVDAAPISRNSLPLIVRPATSVTSFKSRLKTHLYSFNDALFVLLILVFC